MLVAMLMIGVNLAASEDNAIDARPETRDALRQEGLTPQLIPVGEIITSRPYDEEGVGITPASIVKVNAEGEPIDAAGNPVDIEANPQQAVGQVSTGGTFDTLYNPILRDQPLQADKN
jgi:hypothetical protein